MTLRSPCPLVLLLVIAALGELSVVSTADDSSTPQPARRHGAPSDSTPFPSRRGATVTSTPEPVTSASTTPFQVGAEKIVDYTDPTYGGKVRQLQKDDGHEHNFYYYREPWNADGSYLLGIQSDLQQKNWHVVLHDGDGHFIKDLFTTAEYDWRLCWDRKDPDILYTWRGSDLFRFRVKEGKAELMKSFKPLGLMTNGPSVNQDGDRILIATSDRTFHSYHLPDMTDEHAFQPQAPEGSVNIGWDKPRFTGYRNTIDFAFHSKDMKMQGLLVYDDTGEVVHRLDGFGGGGHCAFSPDGHIAYFFMPNYPRPDGKNSLDIHVVKIDGTDDHVVYSVPQAQAKYVQNLHLSWPSKVNDWLVASFYHFTNFPQPSYAPPYDEILQIHLDGSSKYLVRTGGNYSMGAGRGSSTDMFWAMPLAAPQANGKRISFNTNRSGTIDQCILFLDGAVSRR